MMLVKMPYKNHDPSCFLRPHMVHSMHVRGPLWRDRGVSVGGVTGVRGSRSIMGSVCAVAAVRTVQADSKPRLQSQAGEDNDCCLKKQKQKQ